MSPLPQCRCVFATLLLVEAPTIATVLKSMGYATGQFGKNHLGDLNRFLPTVAQSLLEFPPMQKGASFNLQQLKEELDKKMASHTSQ